MKLFIKSLGHAWAGWRNFLAEERNAKIEMVIALFVILAGFVCRISPAQWLIVLFCIALVISLEMINSSIEKFCDVVNPEFHPGIKIIKDIAAGSVLVAAFLSLVIGLIIFIPEIIALLKINILK